MKSRAIFKGIGVCIFLIVILVVSIFFYNFENLGKRRVLYFEAIDGSGLYIESRRITEYSSTQGRDLHVQQFVQELLLGPVLMAERPKLFSEHVANNIDMVQRVLQGLQKSRQDVAGKKQVLEERIARLKELL